MVIEKTDLDEWAKLRDQGDMRAISEQYGILRMTLYNALTEGSCTEKTYTALKKFYEEKKARLQKLTAQ